MKISGSVALVTGANRGIGRQFVQTLIERGAKKVYATARRPELIDIPGVQVLSLDITDSDSVSAAAQLAQDVNLVINNAGINTSQKLVTGDLQRIRLEMDTHYFGTLNVVRAFAPILAANDGGAILNVLSALSWFSSENMSAYCAAKAAEWSMTNGIRLELLGQGTQVTALHMGAVDTDMMAGIDTVKSDPADIAAAALNGVESGLLEVLADATSMKVKSMLSADPSALYPSAATA